MNLEEIKVLLADMNIEAIDIHDELVLIRFLDNQSVIPMTEIVEFAASKINLQVNPETAVFLPGSYEQLAEPLGSPLDRQLQRKQLDMIAPLQSPNSQISVELSKPSIQYLLACLPGLDNHALKRYLLPIVADKRMKSKERATLSDLFSRLTTVKVNATEESEISTDKGALYSIAESALFNWSCSNNLHFHIQEGWSWKKNVIRREHRIESPQFPRRTYNPKLLKYHRLGVSTDSVVLAFLSFYNIVEYFFYTVSEQKLRTCMGGAISTPSFSPSNTDQLHELITLMRDHDKARNEREMLKAVITEYFVHTEVKRWVTKHEADNGTYFTSTQDLFGTRKKLNPSPETVIDDVVDRIYHIRCALVHNKDGGGAVFEPYSQHDEIVSKEIPLIRYIAEQMIVRSGTDISVNPQLSSH
jgi:hypothetical protein